MFILLWAVSGHHYLTHWKEPCKQMLVAHLAAPVTEEKGGDGLRQRLALLGSTDCFLLSQKDQLLVLQLALGCTDSIRPVPLNINTLGKVLVLQWS